MIKYSNLSHFRLSLIFLHNLHILSNLRLTIPIQETFYCTSINACNDSIPILINDKISFKTETMDVKSFGFEFSSNSLI